MNFITYYKIYIEENNVQELNILQCYAFNFLSNLGTLVIAEMLTQNQNEYFSVCIIPNIDQVFN